MTIKVLLVDDDALVRAGLRRILSTAEDIHVVAEMDGITATRTLRQLNQPPHAVVLTTVQADEQVLASLRAGASGFLFKDTPPADIINGIRLVASGEAIVSPSVTRTLLDHFAETGALRRQAEASWRLESLTERKREVAAAVGAGALNADIARSLFMSEATVKAHVSRLFTKLDVTNRVQIAIVVHDAAVD